MNKILVNFGDGEWVERSPAELWGMFGFDTETEQQSLSDVTAAVTAACPGIQNAEGVAATVLWQAREIKRHQE